MVKFNNVERVVAAMMVDFVSVKVNNENCVVFEVLPDHEMDMIATGYFNGNETLLRLTKGDSTTCTVFRKDSKPYSWDWGLGGHTLVSDKTRILGKAIQCCAEDYFNIPICKYN